MGGMRPGSFQMGRDSPFQQGRLGLISDKPSKKSVDKQQHNMSLNELFYNNQ